MYCEACGTQLPLGARACPNCGTLTSSSYADSAASPHDATYVSAPGSSFEPVVAPPPPSTQYGSNPYEIPIQSSYNENPYPVPPPPPPHRKVSPLMLGIFIILVLLIVGASVGFVFLRNNQANTTIPPTATRSTGTSTASNTSNPQANATATATAFYDLYDKDTSSSLPTMDDPLSDNTKGFQWDEGQGCTFTGGAYHVSNAQSSGFQVCLAHKSNFTNFLYQVQMTIIKGSYGSLVFRSDSALSNFYIFRAGQDGVCTFALYKNRVDTELLHSPSLAFKQGPNQTNLLAVIAQGSHLIFYVNAQYVYDINDPSFSSGEIGLVAGSIGAPTEVVYNNAKIWTL